MHSHEESIQAAIADLNSGVFKTQRAAAKAYKVPRSTLQSRLAGCVPHAIAHSNQQRLSPAQEQLLVNWILDEDSRAQPPSHARVREIALRIASAGGDTQPIGTKWVSHFIARNPRVASIVGRSIEAPRAATASPEVIRAFLELFERTRINLGISIEDI
jgi:hypothetical protein